MQKDERKAVRLLRRAAEQDHTAAQCNLGMCLERGEGVAQDRVEAVRYYRLAAGQNFAGAQFRLGVCLQRGLGVAQDLVEAVKYYRLAAAQNYAGAQLNFCARAPTKIWASRFAQRLLWPMDRSPLKVCHRGQHVMHCFLGPRARAAWLATCSRTHRLSASAHASVGRRARREWKV